MCLAVPGEIIEILQDDALLRPARVRFGGESGIVREVSLAYLPAAQIGDYVLIHVGFAISQMDAEAAEKLLQTLDTLEEPSW